MDRNKAQSLFAAMKVLEESCRMAADEKSDTVLSIHEVRALADVLADARHLLAVECEALSERDKDIALAQAVELATYVEGHAKGAMSEAARKFLSVPYAEAVKNRLLPERFDSAVHAEIESACARDGAFFTHCNVRLRIYNGYVPRVGDALFAFRDWRLAT